MKRLLKIGFTLAIIGALLWLILGLNGCAEADTVNENIRTDADNFKIRRRVIALNTRTDKALFEVEGLISLSSDSDGDPNVTIKTDEDDYKLFYAHLSKDVTYTCIQLEGKNVSPYAYSIQFFPASEVIQHGLIDIDSAD